MATEKKTLSVDDAATQAEHKASDEKPECFVIMPISDPDGYPSGHFSHVYKDIFVPACKKAGFEAIRGYQVAEANLIHLDILRRLLEAPMALCDLSSRNPNVLFELGLRQAFDKPVALVQEKGTPRIFDIEPLRHVDYQRELIYHQVLKDQENIAKTLEATFRSHSDGKGINSLVKLLSLTQPASLADVTEAEKDPLLQLVRAEISGLRQEFADVIGMNRYKSRFQNVNFVTNSNLEDAMLRLKRMTPIEIEENWLEVRRIISRNMSDGLKIWFQRAELVNVTESQIIIALRGQDGPNREISAQICEFVENLVGKEAGLTFRAIPSQ